MPIMLIIGFNVLGFCASANISIQFDEDELSETFTVATTVKGDQVPPYTVPRGNAYYYQPGDVFTVSIVNKTSAIDVYLMVSFPGDPFSINNYWVRQVYNLDISPPTVMTQFHSAAISGNRQKFSQLDQLEKRQVMSFSVSPDMFNFPLTFWAIACDPNDSNKIVGMDYKTGIIAPNLKRIFKPAACSAENSYLMDVNNNVTSGTPVEPTADPTVDSDVNYEDEALFYGCHFLVPLRFPCVPIDDEKHFFMAQNSRAGVTVLNGDGTFMITANSSPQYVSAELYGEESNKIILSAHSAPEDSPKEGEEKTFGSTIRLIDIRSGGCNTDQRVTLKITLEGSR